VFLADDKFGKGHVVKSIDGRVVARTMSRDVAELIAELPAICDPSLRPDGGSMPVDSWTPQDPGEAYQRGIDDEAARHVGAEQEIEALGTVLDEVIERLVHEGLADDPYVQGTIARAQFAKLYGGLPTEDDE